MAGNIKLSPVDRLILRSYTSVLDGFSEYLGDGFEFVLHSLEDLDHSVIKVINGHYSHRSVGAPITNLALSLLQTIQQKESPHVNMVYRNYSKTGAPIKAATFPIFGERSQIIGLICINFHLDIPLSAMLDTLLKSGGEAAPAKELLASSSDDLILSTLEEAKLSVAQDHSITAKNKNKEIISLLYQKDIFLFKNAVQKVAGLLNISINTVYMHLRNLKKSAPLSR